MKYKVIDSDVPEIEIEIINVPTVVFEQVEIANQISTITSCIAVNPKWNRLESTSDLSSLYGISFDMISDEFRVESCFVCADKKSIIFVDALKRDIR